MVCVTLRNLLRPAMSAVLNGKYTCTHNGWRLELGWVTTKEYNLLPRLDRETSTYGALTKAFYNNNNHKYVNISKAVF